MGAVTGDNCPQVSYGPHQGRPPDHPSLPLRVTPDRASLRGRAGNAGLSLSSALGMACVLVGASGRATV